jgi:TRAP-type C4-dicarboxylate transport system permease small subunit
MQPPKVTNGRPRSGPPFWRSAGRFLAGLAYLALVAALFSGMTGAPFPSVFLAVVFGAGFSTALALVWLTQWAMRDDGRPGQFGLASLLFLTTFLAVYLAVVRWVVVSRDAFRRHGPWSNELAPFLLTAGLCLVLAVLAIPFLAGMAESLVWLAVWLARRPRVRRWLSRRRARDREESDKPTSGPTS